MTIGDGVDCSICARGRPLDVVGEFPTSWVTAPAEAPLPGYACVVAKRHVIEPFELAETERILFWEECMTAAAALKRLLRSPKINFEIHGNTIAHLHMHIYPRYRRDPYEGGAIDGSAKFVRGPAELRRIRTAMLESGAQ
jgi:diadenosine tetraphosphate (Ap4A) HIT family hydrolase